GEREVARREVEVREGMSREEVLTFTPSKEDARLGETRLRAHLRLRGSDAYRDEMERRVRVEDRKVRVLVVENTPRWEFKFLQANLLRDRRVEARVLLLHADERALATSPFLPRFPDARELRTFDLLILGDVPADALGAERLRWIEEFVREGGGLVQQAGRQH